VIEPARALRDVRASLREQVLPSVGSTHGRTILAAALGVLDAVADQVVRDPRPAEATVAELLPASREWERALAEEAPRAAAMVAGTRGRAESASDPLLAREALLEAAERSVEAAWSQLGSPRREELLAAVRGAVRADIERQRGGSR
jgi:hypothetical protein